MPIPHAITYSLILVGALNWGLVGLFDFNLVTAILGGASALERIVYILVAASAVYSIATHASQCCACGKCGCGSEDGCCGSCEKGGECCGNCSEDDSCCADCKKE